MMGNWLISKENNDAYLIVFLYLSKETVCEPRGAKHSLTEYSGFYKCHFVYMRHSVGTVFAELVQIYIATK